MTGSPPPTAPDEVTRHASAVAIAGRACLILGASGSGKSTLAIGLIGLGATLISDDRVILRATAGVITAHAPDPIRGLIEARGIGLLNAATVDAVPLALVVDLDRRESERLPPRRIRTLLGHDVPCLHNCDHPTFAAAIGLYMSGGRHA
ncbi:HPr kinase/phosphorylase [Roseivivax sp. CAU 1753]